MIVRQGDEVRIHVTGDQEKLGCLGSVRGSKLQEQLKPVRTLNPIVTEPLAHLIHNCLQPSATKRPERMSQIQGTLDQLADEAAAKLSDPAELEE